MPLSTLLNLPCTITRSTPSSETDDYGNPLPDEADIATVCELQQTARAERGDQGETSDTTWLLILPGGTGLDTSDRVTVAGQTYEVIGAPWAARNPRTTAASHVEATLRRAGGERQGS